MGLINRKVLWVPLLASCFWLGICYTLYHHASELALQHQQELEHMHLSTIGQQLLKIRNWNADHGGIYVRESDIGRPNPWLPEHMRHATTTDGRRLVLLNPAYMSRLLAERISSPGMSISIVGKQPMRPDNKADIWEGEALDQCTSGPVEIFTPPDTSSRPDRRMRLLAVLKAEQSCLKCHTSRKMGDVLGGISISQDATSYLQLADSQRRSLRLTYAFMGLTGLLVIGGLTGLLALRRWQAEETNRMQRSLMARLSHDMRTPLTGILGMSELLGQKELSADEREQARRYLAGASSTLLEMVRDITDHAQMEQDNLSLCTEPFDLAQACEQCVDLYRPAARAKGLALDLVIGRRVPHLLMGDAFRIRQVLGNLVSNAVKFTNAGFVRVIALAGKLDNGNYDLRLLVMDSGPGIPEGEEKDVFTMFQRGSHGRLQPGTGLGLGIARGLARKMGGDVVYRPRRKRKGACFTMSMELAPSGGRAPAQQDASGTRPARNAGKPLSGLAILVAEDNAPSRYFLQVALQREGARPILAGDGMQALAALSTEGCRYDLVILDARMPGMGGLELLGRIRRGETAVPRDQRVVVYAAALDSAARETCASLGAQAVLDKPLSFAALRTALTAVMRGERTNPEVAQRAGQSSVWERERALQAVDGDTELFRQLCKVLFDDLLQKTEQLDSMVAKDDREGYRRLVHACKNSAGTLCFARLQAVSRDAEEGTTEMADSAPVLAAAIREVMDILEKELADGPHSCR